MTEQKNKLANSITLLAMTFLILLISSFHNSIVYATQYGYGRLLDPDDPHDGVIGAWIWDRDAYDDERGRAPIIYYFKEDGTYEYLMWVDDDGYEGFDNTSAVIETSHDNWEMTWVYSDGGIIRDDYLDGELYWHWGFGLSNRYELNGHTVVNNRGQAGDPTKAIPITDEAYEDFKNYTGSDWIDFDYDYLCKQGVPKSRKMILDFNDSQQITFDWGTDILKANARNSGLNINLAKACIYLCEGTYSGQTETERRMKKLGFSNPNSQYFNYTYKAYTSPITVASDFAVINGERYLLVAVAVRGTKLEDVDDVLTDINEGVFNDSGFAYSGNNGMNVVKSYCNDIRTQMGIDKNHTILIVTGHSLGAAVAGQIAGNLQNEVALQNHIFGYTFASPYYETHGKDVDSFTNIHNIVNTEDAVPKFPLGGVRYGIDYTFTGDGNDMLDQHMLGTYLRALEKTSPPKTSIKVTAGKKSFKVKWKKETEATGYQIQYSARSNFKGAGSIYVKKYKATSKAITKLRSGKKYYVRVRTYKNIFGHTYYSDWSKVKTTKTK